MGRDWVLYEPLSDTNMGIVRQYGAGADWVVVELGGLEPPTSSMPLKRSPR